MLATRFAGGNEAKLMEGMHKAQLMIAVKTGDLATVRRLTAEGMHLPLTNYVSSTWLWVVPIPSLIP